MRWSMMKRIGRGLTAISSTASTKLTWLATTTAAPVAGMSVSWPLVAENRRKGRMKRAPIARPACAGGSQLTCNG